MKRPLLRLCAIMLLSPPIIAAADGNELLKSCNFAIRYQDGSDKTDEAGINAVYCTAYLHGIHDGINLRDTGARYCLPSPLPNQQVVRIVVKFLNDNPSLLHLDASILAVGALAQAYPCSVAPKKK